VIALVTFEAAFVYYNSYLPRIAPPATLGRVSAAGFAVGYGGSIIAFAVAYSFVAAELYWACFLTAAVQFAVFSLPAFVTLPPDHRQSVPLRVAVARAAGATLATLREIVGTPERAQMRRFLTAYLVYEDGVNTVILFAAIFASRTLGFSPPEIIGLFLVVQVTALVGAAAWARPTDTRGPRFVVAVTLVQWALVTLLAYFVTAKWQFWVVAVLAGTGLGAVQAASRTFMATLIPARREAEFFGFYSLVGKTGAIAGPLVFGGVSWLLAGNQRAAILAVGLFFVAGLVLLSRVRAGGPTAARPAAAV
jgi:UMF1 family MFS transporter